MVQARLLRSRLLLSGGRGAWNLMSANIRARLWTPRWNRADTGPRPPRLHPWGGWGGGGVCGGGGGAVRKRCRSMRRSRSYNDFTVPPLLRCYTAARVACHFAPTSRIRRCATSSRSMGSKAFLPQVFSPQQDAGDMARVPLLPIGQITNSSNETVNATPQGQRPFCRTSHRRFPRSTWRRCECIRRSPDGRLLISGSSIRRSINGQWSSVKLIRIIRRS